MGVSVVIDVSGALRKIKHIDDKFEPSTLTKRIGFDILDWVNENFEKGGIEKSWPPLSRNTVASRRKGSSTPLQDTGILRQSFDMFSAGGSDVFVGTKNTIAKYHEHGTRPYIIHPRERKVLRFMTADGFRFAREVHHPGIPQRKMLPTGVLAKKLALETIDAVRRELRGEGDAG